MIFKTRTTKVSLEDRLFQNTLFLGILAVCVLIVYDVFYTRHYHSVVLEIFTGLVFAANLIYLKNRGASTKQRYFFSVLLFILVNIGWITGAGINLLNSGLYFLCLAVILIINDQKIYLIFFVVFILDLAFLFALQYFTDIVRDIGDYPVEKGNLPRNYITALTFYLFGFYLIIFLKLNYTKERSGLNEANLLLIRKSQEVLSHNEALKSSKEKLDKTVQTLEERQSELIRIKGSLEEKVQERTNDLMKLNERLIAQNQQLEQYAFITSHNLRSPVAQIKGLVNILEQNGQFNKQARETLRRLFESSLGLERVIDDLSTILKLEKDMQQPWQEVDLCMEVDGIIDSLKGIIEKKLITIKKHPIPNCTVKALRPYVYSVFHNIIENAVKYSDDKKDDSFIKIEFSESPEFSIVAITDNGIGIDMDAASGKLFQMYQRFNNTHPGQGFGLFLVKSQMEAMEGKVEVDSVFGQGTIFTLYFLKR